MSFAALADQRMLSSVKGLLGELTWDVEADGYQRLKVPPTADVDSLLRLLLRRGLDPALTSILLDRFEARPIERALIAWDIAEGTLLAGEEAALTERVRQCLRPLKEIGTSNSVAVARDRVEALITAAVAHGDRALGGDESPPSLAAVAALEPGNADAIETALAFAKRLSVAHLPSLAFAFLQILWTRVRDVRALDQMTEIGLDYERFDSIPLEQPSDDKTLERQTYFAVRMGLAQLDTAAAAAILEEMDKFPAIAGSTAPTLEVARTELALLGDAPLPSGTGDRIAALADAEPTWRYGARVRDQIRIQEAPQIAAATLDSFLTSFGNEMHVWAQAGYHEDVRSELLTLVSRELRYGSFSPEAWRAFALFLEGGSAIELELQERSAAQLAAALA